MFWKMRLLDVKNAIENAMLKKNAIANVKKCDPKMQCN